MIVIYEAVRDEEADRNKGEDSEVLLWQKHPPEVGDEVLMGSDRRWAVIGLEHYRKDREWIYVAMVNPLDVPVPDFQDHRSQVRREFSGRVSRYLELSPSKKSLSQGWMMDGSAPKGQLFNYYPTDHPTLQREEPSQWVVDQVEAFLPCQENSSYSAIHLCWCKELAMTIAA